MGWRDGWISVVRRIWRQARCLSYEMGSFFLVVSYTTGINHCGYRIIGDHKMGSFGNFYFLKGLGLTQIARMNANWETPASCGESERNIEHRTSNAEH